QIRMSDELEAFFPGLQGTAYRVTSPPTPSYNCVAWAAGEAQNWWWPGFDPKDYWSPGVARVETLVAFIAAFATLGYEACADDALEPGFEKVALFADLQSISTHAARQLPDGRWTSKLGELDDIEHSLRDVEGSIYGTVVQFLKRLIDQG